MPSTTFACHNASFTAPAVTAGELDAILAAAAPKPVPAEYDDRVVNIIGPDPRRRRATRFRKEYRLKAGTTGQRSDDWSEDTDLRASAHSLREAYVDDLGDVRELLAMLARSPMASVVLGRLRADKRTDFDGPTWLVDRRSHEFYEDRPTQLLPVDIDHLPGDPLDAGDALNDYITEHMPELEGCGYVWTHTGSSGVKNTRVRLWFMLAEPRHLAGCAAWARAVNERAAMAVVDAAIYQPCRLVFTADPELLDANGGKHPRPAPAGVWHARGDLVPADAFPDVLPGDIAVSGASAHARPREKLTAVAAGALLEGVGPGNYNGVIHRWLCHVAWSTPEHRAEAGFESAYATIDARIDETSEPDRLAERLRIHANPRALRRTWDAARERHRQRLAADLAQQSSAVANTLLPSLGGLQIDTTGAGFLEDLSQDELGALREEDGPALELPLSVDDARARLLADFGRVADSILLKHARGHWLFRHPPGLGKSAALKELTKPGILSSYVIRIRVPDHRLAEQLVADLQAAAREHRANPDLYGDLPSKIRHHKGRSQEGMCPDDESRPKADRAAALGVSPKKSVCPECKSRDTCPWLKQDTDEECGIIVEVHASAVAIRRERRADLTIIDESIVSSLVEASAENVDLAALSNTGLILGAPNALGSLGRRLGIQTLAVHAHRADLIAALRKAIPQALREPAKLLIASLCDSSRPATFKAREGFHFVDRDGTALEEAIELESWLQESLVQQIIRAEDVGKDSRVLRAQLAASRHAEALYGAIAASLKCERENVFGVAVFAEKRGGKRREMVKFATRPADVDHIFGNASITLDGTADESTWRALISPTGLPLPGEVIGAHIAVDGAFVRCTQYADKAGSKSSLQLRADISDDEAAAIKHLDALTGASWTRAALGDQYDHDVAATAAVVEGHAAARRQQKVRADANISLIARAACYHAAEAADRAVQIEGRPVSVLLVAQKAIGDLLRPMVPDSVAVEHFGKLRGINKYSQVPVAMIVGRSRPANIDLELLTEALHSHNPAIKTVGRYDVNPKEGRHWLERHPDELVAALQAQITAAGVMQAVARVRAYDRTAAAPVEVHVFGTYDSGLPAELMRKQAWNDADRSPIEIAAARGCVFSDMRLNQRAHADVFPRGAKDGRGQVDRAGKRKFDELLANLARHIANSSLRVQDESGPYLYREVEDANSDPLLGLRTDFDLQAQLALGDALDFTADGAEHAAGRRHRLVKLRVRGAGYAGLAIVAAGWTEADVAQQLGMKIEAWKEQSADDLRRLKAAQATRRPDVR